jgi:selenocysteine lyase/cysteine desulfurase
MLHARRYGLGYRAEFLWQGTADFSAWLAAPSCIALQRALTTSRITAYNHGLVKRAAAMLAAAWGTGQVVGVAADGVTAGLVAVRMPWPLAMPSTSSSRHSRHSSAAADEQLPLAAVRVNSAQQQADADKAAAAADGSPAPPTPDDAAALNLLLRRQHRIEVPVAAVAGLLWCRISAQVYNSMADYERLRDVVLGLKQRC